MFWAVYLAVWLGSWAMMVREGLWSNSIKLVNIVASGLIAFGFYSPLAVYLDEQTGGSNTYWLDFVVIWGLFIVSMIVMGELLTKLASRTRMRFKYPIDNVGGPLFGLVAAWVMAAFVVATLHTAPMPRDAFSGKLVSSEDVNSAFPLTAPDAGWLRFVDRVANSDALGPSGGKVFSAAGFAKIYGDHREAFSKANAKWLRVPRQ
jgi:uncharacterized membrane protein required for colicin V production